jgi:hypothetical protein
MQKFLFTDGISGVKELYSTEEVHTQIGRAPDPGITRVWMSGSTEWISSSQLLKQFPLISKKETVPVAVMPSGNPPRSGSGKNWLKKFLILGTGIAGVLLIVNFTRIKWSAAAPVNSLASRPANVPLMDIDSLIRTIETGRGFSLDRSTRTNLRLRNSWPEMLELRLHAERETASTGSLFYRVSVSIDNSTGFNIDDAVVALRVWKKGAPDATDTLQFTNIRYDQPSSRSLPDSYRGDSISVSFQLIRARSFNFCYSSAVKNNSGNYNDRWFCRD